MTKEYGGNTEEGSTVRKSDFSSSILKLVKEKVPQFVQTKSQMWGNLEADLSSSNLWRTST